MAERENGSFESKLVFNELDVTYMDQLIFTKKNNFHSILDDYDFIGAIETDEGINVFFHSMEYFFFNFHRNEINEPVGNTKPIILRQNSVDNRYMAIFVHKKVPYWLKQIVYDTFNFLQVVSSNTSIPYLRIDGTTFEHWWPISSEQPIALTEDITKIPGSDGLCLMDVAVNFKEDFDKLRNNPSYGWAIPEDIQSLVLPFRVEGFRRFNDQDCCSIIPLGKWILLFPSIFTMTKAEMSGAVSKDQLMLFTSAISGERFLTQMEKRQESPTPEDTPSTQSTH